MAEEEKKALAELAEKVSSLDDAGREAILMCAAAYKAGKTAGEKTAAEKSAPTG